VTLLALAVSGRGVVDHEQPAVYADDEAFLRGRGAFETIRVYGGRPFRLDDHLRRLSASARALALPPPDPAAIRDLGAAALEAAGASDAMLRLYWTPGREGTGRPLAYALVRELPPELEEQRARGIRLLPVRVQLGGPGLLGGVKSTSYALNMAAVEAATRAGADDALLVGANEIVLECSTSNVWWRRERVLYTSSLETGILAGVTRAVVLELAPGLAYAVHEGTFALHELAGADETFTTSSVREVMPVSRLGDEDFSVGAAARELQAELRAAVARI
jgi:4-amino-4-deoxychorismate lyase